MNTRLWPHGSYLLLLAVLLSALYAATMPRTITLEDAGLFQMVCHLGGISHPPGYPLFTLLCTNLVFGDSVLAGNGLSALFAVLAVLVLYGIVLMLGATRLTAFVAAAAYGASSVFWSQAIIIEVYSLAVLLFFICWWLLLCFLATGQQRYWYGLALAAGLAVSNHWPLFILSGLAFLPNLIVQFQKFVPVLMRPSVWIVTVVLFLIGLVPYLSLLMDPNPEIAVFGPVTTDNFLEYVTRSYYSDAKVGADATDKLAYYLWLLKQMSTQLGLIGLPLILLGAVVGYRRLKGGQWFSLLLLLLSSSYILLAMIDARYEVTFLGVFQPYPIIAYSVLAIWSAFGLEWLFERLHWEPWKRFALAGFFLVSLVLFNFQGNDRSNNTMVEDYTRTVLEAMPKDTALFVKGDNQVGPFGFLNRVAEERTDVTVFDMEGLVFSNRLTSPFATVLEKQSARTEYLLTHERPVMSLMPHAGSGTNHGFFFDLRPGREVYELHPEFEVFVDYLLALYESGVVEDYHEQAFIYNRLLAFTPVYLLAIEMDGERVLTESQRMRLARLQSTLPGRVATLQHLLVNGLRGDRDSLLGFAEETLPLVKETSPSSSLALIYEFLGHIHGMVPAEKEMASEMFVESLRVLPSQHNPSACYLKALYEDDVAMYQQRLAETQLPECL